MSAATIGDLIANQTLASVPGDASVREAARLMFDRKVGSVLIVDGGELRGIFTERDALYLFVATRRNSDTTPVSAVMTKDLQTISSQESPDEALRRMIEGGFRHLPVVDDGVVVGVVSRRLLNLVNLA